MLNHIMIDLETLGRKNTSVIVQIAAVAFDPYTGETGAEFCVNIDAENAQNWGLTIDAGTVLFWLEQSREAHQRVFYERKNTLHSAISQFREYASNLVDSEEELIIWGNSPSFDVEILKNAFSVCNIIFPFQFRNERDFRTISKLFPDIAKTHERVGIAHDALDDCRNQIAILHKCYQNIFKVEPFKNYDNVIVVKNDKNTEGGQDEK